MDRSIDWSNNRQMVTNRLLFFFPRFAVIQRETQTLRQELQDAKADAQKRKAELEHVNASQREELKSALEGRDRAMSELSGLRSQINASRVENEFRAAEAARQVTKLAELYERLCASERECSTLTHVWTIFFLYN